MYSGFACLFMNVPHNYLLLCLKDFINIYRMIRMDSTYG